MTYEWDEAKSQSNLEKHGVDFSAIELFDWDTAVLIPSDRHGESRIAAIGYIGSTLFFVVYTPRDGSRRIITIHPASRKDREIYGRTH